MPDMFRNLRVALVAIVNGDNVALVGLQTLMGRVPTGTVATALIFPWREMRADGPLPVIAYQLGIFPQNGKDNDTRRGRLRLAIFAHSLETAENIAARLETLISHAALIAAVPALDAVPFNVTRTSDIPETDDDEGSVNDAHTRSLNRVDVELDVELTQAA